MDINFCIQFFQSDHLVFLRKNWFCKCILYIYFSGHLLFSLFELFNQIVFLPTDWYGCHGKVNNHFDSDSLLMKLNMNAVSSDHPFVLWRHQLRVYVDGKRNFSMRKLAVLLANKKPTSWCWIWSLVIVRLINYLNRRWQKIFIRVIKFPQWRS